jgi:hypothetical protein
MHCNAQGVAASFAAVTSLLAGLSTVGHVELAGTEERQRPAVVVDWDDPTAEAEAPAARELAEQVLPAIEDILFQRRITAPRAIRISLHGDFYGGQPPRTRVPHVDSRGVVHLYRYGPSHLQALPHELVHAILRREGVPYGRFDEEGLAAWVADVVRRSNDGFPTYGQQPDVVAGHWVANGLAVPLSRARADRGDLNLRCSFQIYSLRQSFFIDLGARHGSAAMRRLLGAMGTRDAYRDAFGADLGDLEREWQERLQVAYAEIPDRAAQYARYRAMPALESISPCVPGRDFGVTDDSTSRNSTNPGGHGRAPLPVSR